MAKFKTEFYDRATGSHFAMAWADEEQYRRGKIFLDALTGGSCGTIDSDPDKPEMYILETEAQRDAMLDFRKQMREGRS